MAASGSLLLVLGIVLVFGLALPISMYLAGRRGKSIEQIELLKRAANRARSPWKSEDEDLEELARKVEEIQEKREKSS